MLLISQSQGHMRSAVCDVSIQLWGQLEYTSGSWYQKFDMD
jgi:hypothetical protein